MKVSDYLAKRLEEHGVRHVFMLTGGGAMYLNDSLGHTEKIRPVFQHHEQACAIAAEGYARVSDKVGVVNVTTGPGGINALNGVFGAWTDSIPMLVISGQVKRETCMSSYPGLHLRQLGDQEADIHRLATPITKYYAYMDDPQKIRYHLERALYLAEHGRPGPCWIDIPVDVQAAQVDAKNLPVYDPSEDEQSWNMQKLRSACRKTLERLHCAKRPVILVGTGIRLAKALDVFDRVIRKLGVPVTTAWTAHDLMDSKDPLYAGRPGTIGDRPGNFAVQNADLLLVIGCRLNIRQVSYNWISFARHAFLIQVDIDKEELSKPTVKPHLPVHADARLFLEELDRQITRRGKYPASHSAWLDWCRQRVERYPVVLSRHRASKERINPYHFTEVLFEKLRADDVIVCGNGSACVIPFQAGRIKKGQRLLCNSGNASMGYDLPAAIGAAFARGGKRVVCLAGDGSIQLNIQEFQTIFHYKLPIKLFVLNNNGYLSIRQTQEAFFGRYTGESPSSGMTLPDIVRVAQAYGLSSTRLNEISSPVLEDVLEKEGPFICEVLLDPDQLFEPKLGSRSLSDGTIVSSPLEDLSPFMDREELKENLLIPPTSESSL